MRFKATYILLLVLLGLGLFVYYYDVRGGKERKKKEEGGKKIFHIDKNKITELNLVSRGKKITGVREGENKWRIIDPVATAAQETEWDRMASNLVDLEKEKVVDQNPLDLNEYGLKDPAYRVSAKYNASRTPDLLIGSENPSGTFVYAKLSDRPEVILVPPYAASAFKKDLNDLRDRSLVRANEFDVTQIDLKNTKGEFRLLRSKEGWQLKSPVETLADGKQVSGTLNALSSEKVHEFLDTNPPDKSQTGLDNPTIAVKVLESNKKEPRQLVIGKAVPKRDITLYYATDPARREIFLVDKTIFDKLSKTLFDLRNKSIASFKRWDVDTIQISRGPEKFSLRKPKGEWVVDADNQKANPDKVNAMLEALETESIKQFVDKPTQSAKDDAGPLEVSLKRGNETLVELAFEKRNPVDKKKPAGLSYVRNKTRKEVYLVEKKVLDPFEVTKKDLMETK